MNTWTPPEWGTCQQRPTEIRESMQNQRKTKDLMEKSENIQTPNSMENPTQPMENPFFSKTQWKTQWKTHELN